MLGSYESNSKPRRTSFPFDPVKCRILGIGIFPRDLPMFVIVGSLTSLTSKSCRRNHPECFSLSTMLTTHTSSSRDQAKSVRNSIGPRKSISKMLLVHSRFFVHYNTFAVCQIQSQSFSVEGKVPQSQQPSYQHIIQAQRILKSMKYIQLGW
jgi:hypothetical protein